MTISKKQENALTESIRYFADITRELRKENDELQARIKELEAELFARNVIGRRRPRDEVP